MMINPRSALREAAQYGPRDILVLAAIGEDGINQSTLVSLSELSPPSITNMMDRLEFHGLVRRQPIDRRRNRIELTDRGLAVLRRMSS